MADTAGITFALDLIALILSLVVFFVFLINISKFAPGGKKDFCIADCGFSKFPEFSVFWGFEIAEFLKIIKGGAEGIGEPIEVAFHIL